MQSEAEVGNDFKVVSGILKRYSNDPSKLITILENVQDEFGYLPEGALVYIAISLSIPPAKVYNVASFFSHFKFIKCEIDAEMIELLRINC